MFLVLRYVVEGLFKALAALVTPGFSTRSLSYFSTLSCTRPFKGSLGENMIYNQEILLADKIGVIKCIHHKLIIHKK